MTTTDLSTGIRSKALALGYDACGIIPIGELRGYGEKLAERAKRFPASGRFFEYLRRYTGLEESMPWAKSVIVCSFWSGRYRIPENVQGRIGKSFLVDSRRNPKAKVHRLSDEFTAFLGESGLRAENERDFGSIPLRWAAMRAGIGIIRKNNFYYGPKGSSYWLEAWVVDKELEARDAVSIQPCPPTCTRCVQACPTGSLAEPHAMDPMLCAAFLTTKPGCQPEGRENDLLGQWVYGCDACQDACPFNIGAEKGDELFPELEELCQHLDLTQIVGAEYAFLREVVAPKFWYIAPEDVWKWKNNALNAMRLNFKEEYRRHIENALKDENDNVRAMAQWVLEKIPESASS